MGFLAGKRVLITGLLSNRSIAYGVAKAARREGADLAFTYQNERFKDRVTEMAGEFGSTLVFPCDVASDAEIAALFSELGKKWNALDGLVHAVAFAPREAITGDFLEGLSREAFRIAHDVSSYSFAALAKAALPLMQGRPAALVTLTYLGADRVVPGYNTMGLAKASLEAGRRVPGRGPQTERHSRQRDFGRPDQDSRGERDSGIQQDPQVRRGEFSDAAKRDDGERGQRSGVSAVRPGGRGDRRDHLRGRRIQYRGGRPARVRSV